jgi:2,3-dihydroxy-2,3-dihydrophenylpropionate dehydrogenase
MGVLQGSSVLITGGASGLGRALVDRFVLEGAAVTVLDRSKDRLGELQSTYGGAVNTVHGDVTVTADNAAAVSAAVAANGGLDVFIANAGLWDFGQPLLDMEPDTLSRGFDELFAVNVKGYLLGARAAAGPLRERGGSMIFTLSNASFFPRGGGPLYTASKHAGVGIVRQLAYELAPEVRVNGVATGGMPTDLRGPSSLGLDGRSIADVPIGQYLQEHWVLKRAVQPEDYVGAYVLLASARDSSTVTGTVFDLSSVGTPTRN